MFSRKENNSTAIESLVNDANSHFKRLEGVLKKKNSKGQWKDRKCILTDDTFTALKSSKKGNDPEAKECFDVKLLDSAHVAGDVMELNLINGETYLFKGTPPSKTQASNEGVQYTNDADEWRRALSMRIDWALAKVSSSVSNTDKIHISGRLAKKSHNKYQLQMQERFVKVQGTSLYYYKKEGDEKESGVVSLLNAEFIRPYDRSAECKVFEVFEGGRLYSFQTETTSELKRWLDVMNAVRDGLRGLAQVAAKEKELAATPLRIRIFDQDGIPAFQAHIMEELEELYNMGRSGQEEEDEDVEVMWNLQEHLRAAKAIHSYLDNFVPEIRSNISVGDERATKGPRYDILAIFVLQVNTILTVRLLPALQVNSDQIRHSNLLDLHQMIDWLTRFQQTLKRCHCPISALTSVQSYLPANFSASACPIFDALYSLCHRYVNGAGSGREGDGAATHLIDHCMKVWNRLINSPAEMLQRHMDGSFYTAAPTAMWESLHQHLRLATTTQSPVLHVMVADKIAAAIVHITYVIEDYVESVDLTTTGMDGVELKEIELEYLSALANDNALHLEEVISSVESFELDEIRARIDELFDPVTARLVKCGQTCLRRLSSVLYLDVEPQIVKVFTDDWLEGSQLQVVTATLTDYMRDLQQYLMPFWTEKFIYILLELVILQYTRAVIIAGSVANTQPQRNPSMDQSQYSSSPDQANKKSTTIGFLKGIGNMFKDKAVAVVNVATLSSSSSSSFTKYLYCRADSESLGQLAQDVNVLNHFFHVRAGQETATEFLGLINDVSVMLFQELDELQIHILSRIAVYPASAQAIYDVVMHCLRMRDDVSRDEITEFSACIHPGLVAAPQAAEENNDMGIAEGRLGLLYADLMALVTNGLTKQQIAKMNKSATAGSLAQKLKDMANIPLAALKKAILEDEEDEEDGEGGGKDAPPVSNAGPAHITQEQAAVLVKRRLSFMNKQTDGLVDDVLDVLQQQDDELEAKLLREEQIRQKEEERRLKSPGVVSLEGHLDKKSPAHNLWQSRWFKILTRDNPVAVTVEDGDIMDESGMPSPYIYQLLFYKKKGGSAIKAIDSTSISHMYVLQCNRALSWLRTPRRLLLQSEVDQKNMYDAIPALLGGENRGELTTSSSSSSYVFVVVESGHEYILRASKIDKMIIWMNTLAAISMLAYDAGKDIWTRDAYLNPSTTPPPTPPIMTSSPAQLHKIAPQAQPAQQHDYHQPAPPLNLSRPEPVTMMPLESSISEDDIIAEVEAECNPPSTIASSSPSYQSSNLTEANIEKVSSKRSTSIDYGHTIETNSIASSSASNATTSKPVTKITGDGKYVTNNPLRMNDPNTVRNPVLDPNSYRTSASDLSSEVKDERDSDAMYEALDNPKTPRRKVPASINTQDHDDDCSSTAGSENGSVASSTSGTISPSSRSLFKKRLNKSREKLPVESQPTANAITSTAISGNVIAKTSPSNASGAGGLMLFNPVEMQHNRIHEAEVEWNKYYSEDSAESTLHHMDGLDSLASTPASTSSMPSKPPLLREPSENCNETFSTSIGSNFSTSSSSNLNRPRRVSFAETKPDVISLLDQPSPDPSLKHFHADDDDVDDKPSAIDKPGPRLSELRAKPRRQTSEIESMEIDSIAEGSRENSPPVSTPSSPLSTSKRNPRSSDDHVDVDTKKKDASSSDKTRLLDNQEKSICCCVIA